MSKEESDSLSGKVDFYIQELRNMILSAYFNYDIWWVYKEKNERERYIDILNRYQFFFRTSIHAHFVSLVVALYMLLECREDTVNIPNLVKILEENAKLQNNSLVRIEEEIGRVKPLWTKIAILRSNIFAHRKNEDSAEELFAIAKITPDEIKELVESLGNILNGVTKDLNESTYFFHFSNAANNLRDLLDHLKESGNNF